MKVSRRQIRRLIKEIILEHEGHGEREDSHWHQECQDILDARLRIGQYTREQCVTAEEMCGWNVRWDEDSQSCNQVFLAQTQQTHDETTPGPPVGLRQLDNDPCFDGRPGSYRHDTRNYGDWVYKVDNIREQLSEMLQLWGEKTTITPNDVGWIRMKVYKVVSVGTSGRTDANAEMTDMNKTFLLSDIKPRKSEEAAKYQDHPLTTQVVNFINTGNWEWAIDCPEDIPRSRTGARPQEL